MSTTKPSGESKLGAAILGSGNIGTDLLIKLQASEHLEPRLLVGIDPNSDGLARAKKMGIPTTDRGLAGLLEHLAQADKSADAQAQHIDVVFDATSAKAHLSAAPELAKAGKDVVDLTPAAVGPYAVPVANLAAIVESGVAKKEPINVNMVTCGGQATIPMVTAMSEVGEVLYAEIVASISSKSAGPGTRANIDEFTTTTARAIEAIGGAKRGKAIIVLNPAEPPLLMRDTVYGLVRPHEGTLTDREAFREALTTSITEMVEQVQAYVPGYRLVQAPVFDTVDVTIPAEPGSPAQKVSGEKVTVLLQVEGAGDWLPSYAGNLDIMTAAALKVGEELAVARSSQTGEVSS